MDVSRSGRVRKKSSKLADFESPDDLELNQEETVSKKRSNRDSEVKTVLRNSRIATNLFSSDTLSLRYNDIFKHFLLNSTPRRVYPVG